MSALRLVEDPDALVSEIHTELRAADAAWADALGHAIRAGELLAEMKARVGHGNWLPWLDAQRIPRRTASSHMRLYAYRHRVAHLGSVRQAIDALVPERPSRGQLDQRAQWRRLERRFGGRPDPGPVDVALSVLEVVRSLRVDGLDRRQRAVIADELERKAAMLREAGR